jgi:hypothetical protein
VILKTDESNKIWDSGKSFVPFGGFESGNNLETEKSKEFVEGRV